MRCVLLLLGLLWAIPAAADESAEAAYQNLVQGITALRDSDPDAAIELLLASEKDTLPLLQAKYRLARELFEKSQQDCRECYAAQLHLNVRASAKNAHLSLAQAMIGELFDLARSHPAEPKIWEFAADAGALIVPAYRQAGQHGDAERVYYRLIELWIKLPRDETATLSIAKAAYDMVGIYADLDDFSEAADVLLQLSGFAKVYPKNEHFAIHVGANLQQVIMALTGRNRWPEARELASGGRRLLMSDMYYAAMVRDGGKEYADKWRELLAAMIEAHDSAKKTPPPAKP